MRWYQWLLWKAFGCAYCTLEDQDGWLYVRRLHTAPCGNRSAYGDDWRQRYPLSLNADGTVTGRAMHDRGYEVSFKRWYPLTPDPIRRQLMTKVIDAMTVEEYAKRIEAIESAP